MAAMRIELKDGWKTYWRAPGEAGIPPTFNWQGSDNLKSVKLFWPTPKVFTVNGLQSIGYKGVIILPIELTPAGPADTRIALRGQLDLGVCEDICVPISVQISADLQPGGVVDDLIRASLDHQPATAAAARVKSVSCKVEPMSDGLRLTAIINLPRQGKSEVAVVELPDPAIWIATTETSRSGRVLTASTELVPPDGKPFLLNRSDVRITVIGDGKAVDIQGCAAG